MCTGIDIFGSYMLHPEGEARYGLCSTPRCAHGFVATRPTPRKTSADGNHRNSPLFLARCALPCTQRVALHTPFNCRF